MQDTENVKPLLTEAKLTSGQVEARSAPTVKAAGTLNVQPARDVYLNLDADTVVRIERLGNDLLLTDAEGEVLKLQGFFEGDTPRRLFLETNDDRLLLVETGGLVSDGPVAMSVTPQPGLSPFASLTDGGAEGVMAGGMGAGALIGGALAVGALAAVAGGGGGGGSDGGDNEPAAPPPDTTPPGAPTNLAIINGGAALTGRGEPGATVTLRNQAGQSIGSGRVGDDGAFTINLLPPLTNGEVVSVRLTDAAGNASAASDVTAPDTTAPSAPTDVQVAEDGSAVTGEGEPGATVVVRGPDGGVIGTGQVGQDGSFTIPLTPPLTGGESVSVRQEDAAGNPSAETTANAPDLIYPGGSDGLDAPVVLVPEAVGGVNGQERADGVQVRIGLTPGTQAGDRVLLTVGGAVTATFEHVVTAGEAAARSVEMVLPATYADGAYTVSAVIDDGKGHASSPSATVAFVIDGSTPSPVITTANGGGLSGTAEAGATIALLDQNGAPVLNGAGLPVTTTVAPDGAWSLAASAVSGGLNGFDGTVRATDPAGNTASTDVGPIDGATAIPVITGANGQGLQGTAEAGATITLLDENGAPVIGAGGAPVTAVVGPNGVWTLPASAVPGGLNGFEGGVRAVDPAGNSATAPVGPVDGTVTVSINADAVTSDNILNLAEAAAPSVTISGTAFGDFNAGDVVTVRLSNGALATTGLNPDGTWSVVFAGSALAASTSVTAELATTDASGNAAVVTDVQTYGVDLSPPPAPVITSANGAGVSGTAEANATITLLDDNGAPIAQAIANGSGRWTIPASDVPVALDGFTGSVRVTDPPGNPTVVPVGPIDGVTGAPVVTGANGLGLTGTAEAGAVVSLTAGDGQPVRGADGAPVTAIAGPSGSWTIPASAVPGGLDGFTGSVTATDPAGNSASTGVGPVDGATTTPIILEADGGAVAGLAEAGATVTLLNASGQPVTGVNGQPVRVVADGDGAWRFPATDIPGGLDGFTGSVSAVDPAGNAAAAAVGPIDGSVTASVSLALVTADGVLNLAESQGDVTLTGSASGDYVPGQTVTITTAAGATFTGVLAVDGTFSVLVSGAALAASTSVKASISVTSSGGGTVAIEATRSYVVDLEGEPAVVLQANGAAITGTAESGVRVELLNANGVVVATVTAGFDGAWSAPASLVAGGLNGFTGSVRTIDAAGNPASVAVGPIDGSTPSPVITTANGGGLSGTAEAGATIALLDQNGAPVLNGAGLPVTTTVAPDGAWSLAASAVSGGLNGFDGTVRATDPAGNTASTDVGPIDGATAIPVITGANGQGLQGTAEAGATITLLDENGAPVIGAGGAPVTAVVGPNGVWTLPASAVPGGLNGFEGGVRAVDPAGNSATAPVGPVDGTVTVSINADAVTSDNILNLAEAAAPSVTISGTAFGDFNAGDVVTVRLSNGALATTGLNPDGTWSVVFAGSALAASTSVTAELATTDASGNAAVVTDVQTYGVDLSPPPAPVITSANGAGVSGTAEANATITLLDANGAPVRDAGGAPVMVTVGANGVWVLPATAVQGGLDGFTGSVRATDTSGNPGAPQPLGPIDGATPAPTITVANGAGLEGVAEAGAVITLVDANGAPVIGAGGAPVTMTADGDGDWSIPATDVPGGLDGFEGAVVATDPVGNSASGAVGPVDGTTPVPTINAANGAVLSGSAEPGATITLLDAAGNPVTDVNGAPVTTLANGGGVWTIPASVVPGGLNGFEGSVQATDPAGNTAQAGVGPIDGAVNLTLTVDPVTADNVLNGAEAAQASVVITGAVTGEFTAGDLVRVELAGGVFQQVAVDASGAWSASFSGAQLAAGAAVTASITVQDNANNTVSVTEVQAYAVDLTTPTPVVTSANGAGLSGTAEGGALIVVRNAAGAVVGSTTADASGVWTIPGSAFSVGLNGLSGSIQATDAAGNSAVAPLNPVDGAVNLSIGVNAVTSDDVINIAEAGQGAVAVGGTVAGEFATGDPVVVTLANGATQTTTLDAAGAWSVAFAGADLAASAGLTVAVTSTDAAGNTATVSVQKAFGVDTTAPGAPLVTAAGAAGLSGTAEAGVTIQLLDGSGAPVTGAFGQPITVQATAGGVWSVPASAFVGGAVPTGFTGQVRAVDAAGNTSAPTVVPAIDLTPPDSTTTTLSIGVIAGDDVVNLAESQGSVVIGGQVGGEFRAGDVVTVTAGSATATGVVSADGRWTAVLAGSALTGGVLQATVQASDAAGNLGAISATRPYTVDLVSPGGVNGTSAPVLSIAAAADGLVSPAELSAGVSAVVALTPTAQAGDTVALTLTTGGVAQTLTLVLTPAEVAAGQAVFALSPSLIDGAYSAVAVIRDPAGNVSAPSATLSFAVDVTPLAVGVASASVAETALGVAAVGTLDVTGATGAVAFSLQAPTSVITSRGATVTWTTLPDGTLLGAAAGREVVRVTINASGGYSVTLLDAVDHAGAGADTVQLPIRVVATDSDGSVSTTITVGIVDGVPQLSGPVTLAPTEPGIVVGSLVQSFGPDGGHLTSVTIDGRVFSYNAANGAVTASGPAGSVVAYSVRDGVLSATTLRGEAITVDFATGAYQVGVTGQESRPATQVAPEVALGGGSGLLGLIDADVLGLIQLDQQQFFTASDANNDISQVVVRYSSLVSIGNRFFGFSSALATELGLVVTPNNVNSLLLTSSQLTIRSADGGPIDNLKLNEFLGSITFTGGLASLLSLNIGQSLSIQATDSGGRTVQEAETNLADLGVLAGLLGGSPPGQIINGTSGNDPLTASDVGTGAALDNRMYGYGGADTLNGGLGNDLLRGGAGADTLNGGAGNDLLVGGTGNDTLTGGAGQDVFRWERGDQGTTAAPAADIITDFSLASLALGGDVLDLSSLLQGEGRIGTNPGNLTNFIHFQQTANGTLVHISSTGGFIGGFGSATAAAADQTILLRNVNLTAGFSSDQAILADLLDRGKLIVDELTTPAPGSDVLTIGGSVVDGDGDSGATTLAIDSAAVQPLPAAPGNVAPVVGAQADALLGLLGLGVLGLNLGEQDLLAADANNNLSRVEVEYAPLLAVNLSPLTFAYAESLAASFGYSVQVNTSPGLLGVVAPSARITITALDGGPLDNVEINRFLETVHLTDTSGALLSSTLLSAQLLNALTLTAEDAQGLGSSVTVGSVVNVNALNSLDGPDPVLLSASALFADEAASAGLEVGWGQEDLVRLPMVEVQADVERHPVTFEGLAQTGWDDDGSAAEEAIDLIAAFTESGEGLYLPGAEDNALAPTAGTAFSAESDSMAVDFIAAPPPLVFDEEASTVHA
ncbi:Ig-like domain-containing protein [Brevundimonas sp.]|uniref:Ig-like domain-containing protein n=2 Tax=unclassified Brevundimonas TaxID=2622653 RepID=UPI002897339F|nr:Ig-like domain-containing protein [Brevundimonas sp.]